MALSGPGGRAKPSYLRIFMYYLGFECKDLYEISEILTSRAVFKSYSQQAPSGDQRREDYSEETLQYWKFYLLSDTEYPPPSWLLSRQLNEGIYGPTELGQLMMEILSSAVKSNLYGDEDEYQEPLWPPGISPSMRRDIKCLVYRDEDWGHEPSEPKSWPDGWKGVVIKAHNDTKEGFPNIEELRKEVMEFSNSGDNLGPAGQTNHQFNSKDIRRAQVQFIRWGFIDNDAAKSFLGLLQHGSNLNLCAEDNEYIELGRWPVKQPVNEIPPDLPQPSDEVSEEIRWPVEGDSAQLLEDSIFGDLELRGGLTYEDVGEIEADVLKHYPR